MTEHHYAAIAEAVAAKVAEYDTFAEGAAAGFDSGFAAGQLQALTEVSEFLADLFATDILGFDREKFRTICNI